MSWFRYLGRAPFVVVALATVVAAATPSALGQDSATEDPARTPTPQPTAIPAADISTHAAETRNQLREITARSERQDHVELIRASLQEQADTIEFLERETAGHLDNTSERWSLEELQNRWLREQRVVADFGQALKVRAEKLEVDLQSTRDMQDLWQLTRDNAVELELPDALRRTVNETLQSISETRGIVSIRRDEVLTIQTEVSTLESRISDGMTPVREGMRAQNRSLLIPERPPLWRASWLPDGQESLARRLRQTRREDLDSIRSYLTDHIGGGTGQAVLLLVLVAVFWRLGRRASAVDADDHPLRATTSLLKRPVASAVLISALADDWFHPNPPLAWSELMGLVLLAALCRLLPPILPRNLRPVLIILVVLYLILQVTTMLPKDVLLFRLVLLVLAAATGGALAWLIGRVGDARRTRYPTWVSAAVVGCRLGIVLAGISTVANIIGAVDLAGILVYGILVSVYFGVLYWTGTLVLEGALATLLRTSVAQKLSMVRDHKTKVFGAFENLINLLAVVLWLRSTLWGFGLLDECAGFLKASYSAEFSFFGTPFRPFAIVPILIVIYLSFKVSRLIRFVLEVDVLPSFALPRGVPNTISTITHYAVLFVGFLIVVTMSGIPLDKFTIIAGALSVGIGFGLQNVVNNFVSGLILLFERPISEGDKIQVGSISGVVKQIGIRASIVRTWQGAEVIVPNADLISKELTNWTLFDMRRRIEIPIGTAYGSDPERVMSLLNDVAVAHPDVLDDPSPSVPFMGFGDSSLDFELRVWTLEDIVRVQSELAVSISRSFAEAGIEIPFPQRDVHLRTPQQGPESALPAASSDEDSDR
jgi:small-conductance mechanosensitive channel